MIYDAFLAGRFPIKLMKPVDREYFKPLLLKLMKPVDRDFKPSYEEFKPKTLWSLENAFISTFKQLKPIPPVSGDRSTRHLYQEHHSSV